MQQYKARNALYQTIRAFFAQRDVLEVETPLLGISSASDPCIASFSVAHAAQKYFLQTSPELAMKRILAEYHGSIFQITKAFRAEEMGKHHHHEFTMLEWYRVGMNMQQLMQEVAELLQVTCDAPAATAYSYQQLFLQYLACDPLTATAAELRQLLTTHLPDVVVHVNTLDVDTMLQLLFTEIIEPHLAKCAEPSLVYHYPASMAALAELAQHDDRVAMRFELYWRGLELANGYQELRDATEQQRRWQADNDKRQALGLPNIPIDPAFIAALQRGIPFCSGVALGLDRLLMLNLGMNNIQDVMPG